MSHMSVLLKCSTTQKLADVVNKNCHESYHLGFADLHRTFLIKPTMKKIGTTIPEYQPLQVL